MADNLAVIRNLESKVSHLDRSMVQMADSLSQFMQRQAVHDERSLRILDSLHQQKGDIGELRALVLPLVGKVTANEVRVSGLLKIAGVVLTSGSIGAAVVKLSGF